jgi:hypothetical protein
VDSLQVRAKLICLTKGNKWQGNQGTKRIKSKGLIGTKSGLITPMNGSMDTTSCGATTSSYRTHINY